MRALGLVSGGLDGLVAVRLLESQGIDVRAATFATGFARQDREAVVTRRAGEDAREGGVRVVDVAEEYLRSVVVRPKYGYGRGMNPCIDCRIFVLSRAREMADRIGAEVVVTGEVLGQTRMAQRRSSLALVEEAAGLRGRLLRPLSAQLLPETDAERSGAIERRSLGAIHGRSRRAQLALAERLGVRGYAPPGSGCCLLADAGFARRLRDLLDHAAPGLPRREQLDLLALGRHFRLSHDLKAVVARDARESEVLERLAGDRWVCQVADGHGAVTLADGEPTPERLLRVAALAARYSRHRVLGSVEVRCRRGPDERSMRLRPERDPEPDLL